MLEVLQMQTLGWAATDPHGLLPDQERTLRELRLHLLKVCRDAGFTECEAGFANAMGVLSSQKGEADLAEALLTRAAALYRTLSSSAPVLYRADFAMTLYNLATHLSSNVKPEKACEAYRESLAVYKELAETAPERYLGDVALGLKNLGHGLQQAGRFEEARAAHDEAAQAYRCLERFDPIAGRTGLAETLNNVVGVLQKLGHSSDARMASEEAVRILRQLAHPSSLEANKQLAQALTNLGAVLSSDGHFDGASIDAYREAISIYRSHGEPLEEAGSFAEALDGLAGVLRRVHRLDEANAAGDEALSVMRQLAQSRPDRHLHSLAMRLVNRAHAYGVQRRLDRAEALHEEAVGIFRRLTASRPMAYRDELATALLGLGSCLVHRGKRGEARSCIEEGVRIRRETLAPSSKRSLRELSKALVYLANSHNVDGDYREAARIYEEAVRILEQLTDAEDHLCRAGLQEALHNYGQALYADGRFAEARRAWLRSLDVLRALSTDSPSEYSFDLSLAYDSLARLSEKMGKTAAAQRLAREAIRAAEHSTISSSALWLAKGRASWSYQQGLASVAMGGQLGQTFRYLAALREGHVRSLKHQEEHGLSYAVDSLTTLRTELQREVRVLLVQELGADQTLLAALDTTPPFLHVCVTRTLLPEAAQFRRGAMGSMHAPQGDGSARPSTLHRVAKKVWDGLPGPIRDVLHPSAEHCVLVSEGEGWSNFPWELVRYGPREDDLLGLRRVLPRWRPITGDSLRCIARRPFGSGEMTGAVLAPWDTVLLAPLVRAVSEAYEASSALLRRGFRLLPNGGPLMGTEANHATLSSLLSHPPSVIHFTGHGSVFAEEEGLLMWVNNREYAVVPFDRKQVALLKEALGKTEQRLMDNHALVVLNCCFAGRSRVFGGQAEDLAWTFLAEGAETVIASALPIVETIGEAFGVALYEPAELQAKSIGEVLLCVRRKLFGRLDANVSNLRSAWGLIHCYGNPFAHLPSGSGPHLDKHCDP